MWAHALRDSEGRWLTGKGTWGKLREAALYGPMPAATGVLKTFEGDLVSVRAVRVRVVIETIPSKRTRK